MEGMVQNNFELVHQIIGGGFHLQLLAQTFYKIPSNRSSKIDNNNILITLFTNNI